MAGQRAAQSTYFVDDDAMAGGDGTLGAPFADIQVAVNASRSGDTILVQPGRYGMLDFLGKNVEVRSLEGYLDTRVSDVVFASGESRGAVLCGFTLLGNSITCVGASPTIRDNLIMRSGRSQAGGGISLSRGSDALIEHNQLIGNSSYPTAAKGGGIYVSASEPVILGNELIGNDVYEDYGGSQGGGIYLVNSTVLIAINLFRGNSSTDFLSNEGGGLYAVDCTLDLRGNTFVDNVCFDGAAPLNRPGVGGALFLLRCVTTSANNCFWNNQSALGHEIHASKGLLTLNYTDVDITQGGISGDATIEFGPGVLHQDPLLDIRSRLVPDSPLIDMGEPVAQLGGLDGNLKPRIVDGDFDGVLRQDIGWDEWNPSFLIVNGTGMIGTRLGFVTRGRPGQVYLLGASLGTGNVLLKNFGGLLLDPSSLMILGSGAVPGNNFLDIPLSTSLIGLRTHFQALVRNPREAIGSLSNRVDLTLR